MFTDAWKIHDLFDTCSLKSTFASNTRAFEHLRGTKCTGRNHNKLLGTDELNFASVCIGLESQIGDDLDSDCTLVSRC